MPERLHAWHFLPNVGTATSSGKSSTIPRATARWSRRVVESYECAGSAIATAAKAEPAGTEPPETNVRQFPSPRGDDNKLAKMPTLSQIGFMRTISDQILRLRTPPLTRGRRPGVTHHVEKSRRSEGLA